MLVAAQFLAAPIVTAMAIIALGATDALITRFRNSAAAFPVLALHGMTYLLLYALFIGARLHMPAAAPTPGVSTSAMLDVAASAFPMAVAIRRILSCLRQSLLSRH